MGTFYIVRHGETLWNAEGRIQGHTDVGLTERGREQARVTARRLSDIAFGAAYSSDMSRTRETAEIILGERDTPLKPVPELREYNKGVFEGLTPEEYREQYPQLYESSLVNDPDFAPPGGETIRQCQSRISRFLSSLRELHPGDDVLIVGHGGSLRSGIVALLELPLEANWKFVMHNCALSVVRTYPDNSVMHLYNDTSHLKDVG
ncbi:MAG: histidine phosphatase family protein [Chloroflexota bacterium]|nr:histidine phosphatase family protein [Chloroflexota bacterium]